MSVRPRTAALIAVPTVPGLALLAMLATAAPASATPSASAVLANTFPVQCTSDGASTVTGKLTVSAAGPAVANVGDTITVSDYTVDLALDRVPMPTNGFKGATPSFEVDGSFTGNTLLTGAMTAGPVTSTGSLARSAVSPNGAADLKGAASAPISFTAAAAGGVVVTSASPILATLNWYVVGVEPAAGSATLPTGIPTVNRTTPYGTSTLSCTGNPVLPWGTVEVVAAGTSTATPGSLASTGTRTENFAVAAGWLLVAGVGITFFARRRRTV